MSTEPCRVLLNNEDGLTLGPRQIGRQRERQGFRDLLDLFGSRWGELQGPLKGPDRALILVDGMLGSGKVDPPVVVQGVDVDRLFGKL